MFGSVHLRILAVLAVSTSLLALEVSAEERPLIPLNREELAQENEALLLNDLKSGFSANQVSSAKVTWDSTRAAVKEIRNIRIPAPAILASASDATRANVEEVSRAFAAQHMASTGLNPDQLESERIWENVVSSGKRLLVNQFAQNYAGLEVVGSHATFTYVDGELTTLRSTFLSDLQLDTTPVISAEQAFTIAKRIEINKDFAVRELNPEEPVNLAGIKALPESKIFLKSSRLVVAPRAFGNTTQGRLSWELKLRGDLESGLQLVYFIDAKMGIFLHRTNLAHSADSVSGEITSSIFPQSPLTPAISQPIAGVSVWIKDRTYGYTEPMNRSSLYGSYYSLDDVSWCLDCEISVGFAPYGLSGSYGQGDFSLVDSSQLPTTLPASSVNYYHSPGVSFNNSSAWPSTVNVHLSTFDAVAEQAANLTYHLNAAKAFFSKDFMGPFDLFGFQGQPRLWVVFNRPQEGCNATFATDSLGLISSELESDFEYFMFFGPNTEVNGNECRAGALAADIIYHEVGHMVVAHEMGYEYDNLEGFSDRAAILEGISDYWAATMTNDAIIGEGFYLVPGGTGLRSLNNSLTNDNFFPTNDEHYNGLIIGGALWDLRSRMINQYGAAQGISKADELLISTLKGQPNFEFVAFLGALLDTDININSGSHFQMLCDEFHTQRKIHHPACDPAYNQTPTPTPVGGGGPSINRVRAPIPQTHIDTSFSSVWGSVQRPNLASFSLGLRPFGGLGSWQTTAFNLTNGGSQNMVDAILGTMNTSVLRNGCYYDMKLESVDASSGAVLSTNLTVKHQAGAHDSMPRMICLARTAHQGEENDACQIIAIASDPKFGYYSLTTSDWRRGRPHLLASRPNDQYYPYRGDPDTFGPALCDPDGHTDCLRDCWNIIGTGSNNNGGNDGLNNIFCQAGAGCSPVSFTGCEHDNPSCVNSAITSLEGIYHKIVYFHYANWDVDWGDPSIPYRRFERCDDDGGDQFYTMLGTSGGNTVVSYRRSLVAQDRPYQGSLGDIFDAFEELYSLADNVPRIDPFLTNPLVTGRVGISPAVNCTSCGCPSSDPYCNSSTGLCEKKCSNGLAFGQCNVVNGRIYICDNGSLVEGCNRNECAALSCASNLYCNNSNGRCQQCLNDSHCVDSQSCTNDRCSNGYCINSWVPSDCNLLPGGRCGRSPSGCHTCGCSCDKSCVDQGQGVSMCRPNLYCDPRKCKACNVSVVNEVYSGIF